MTNDNIWSATRRARRDASALPADELLSLVLKHARAGDFAKANRAALLADRLLRLEAIVRQRRQRAAAALRLARAALDREAPLEP